METPKFSESMNTLSDHLKEYVNLRVDLLKLVLVEKMSRLTSLLLLLIFVLILVMFAGVFLGLAFVLWYGQNVGPMWAGALIIVGVLVLKGTILYLFRKRFLLNPVIKQLSKIIMEEPGDGEE
jgi:hypothetical protein